MHLETVKWLLCRRMRSAEINWQNKEWINQKEALACIKNGVFIVQKNEMRRNYQVSTRNRSLRRKHWFQFSLTIHYQIVKAYGLIKGGCCTLTQTSLEPSFCLVTKIEIWKNVLLRSIFTLMAERWDVQFLLIREDWRGMHHACATEHS